MLIIQCCFLRLQIDKSNKREKEYEGNHYSTQQKRMLKLKGGLLTEKNLGLKTVKFDAYAV